MSPFESLMFVRLNFVVPAVMSYSPLNALNKSVIAGMAASTLAPELSTGPVYERVAPLSVCVKSKL